MNKLLIVVFILAILIVAYPNVYQYALKLYRSKFFEEKLVEIPYATITEREKFELLKEGSGKILFDQSHENRYLVFGETASYSHFASLFIEAGYNLEAVDENLEEKLQEAKVLIIAKPNQNYSIEKILKFVEDGNILLLIGDVDRKVINNLNEISLKTGIIFNDDYIYDLYNYSILYSYPVIFDFELHKITLKLKYFVVYESCSLKVFKGISLAKAGENAKSSKGYKELTVLAVREYGKGVVVTICDGDIWNNENIEKFDNKNLLINLVNWIQKK